MYVIADDATAELPAVVPSPPESRRGRTETIALVAGSILVGALVVAIAWWWVDPLMPRESVANIIFMTLTSGAVVALLYAMVRSMIRAEVTASEARIVYAVETHGQSLRSMHRDTQWQIAAGRNETRKARVFFAEKLDGLRGRAHAPRPRRPRRRRAPGASPEPPALGENVIRLPAPEARRALDNLQRKINGDSSGDNETREN